MTGSALLISFCSFKLHDPIRQRTRGTHSLMARTLGDMGAPASPKVIPFWGIFVIARALTTQPSEKGFL